MPYKHVKILTFLLPIANLNIAFQKSSLQIDDQKLKGDDGQTGFGATNTNATQSQFTLAFLFLRLN
ncbi:hypothetical protein BXP28_15280 [Paenibacillus larvae subsp. larvae]|nr:hypothetical protein BXP28_15280 [Paenibacillus larvae subsp. larvae]